MALSEQTKSEIKKLINKYPQGKQKSALIPALHVAQIDNQNWLSAQTMDEVAAMLDIAPIEVYEVATFYSQFNLQPVGKYVLEVCQTGPCMIEGADDIINYIKEKLNISVGQTTTDGRFTLKTVECLGACGYAPMLQLGEHYREHLTKAKIDQMIAELN
jgi:NADH-quinone oxidoreductase subunit E